MKLGKVTKKVLSNFWGALVFILLLALVVPFISYADIVKGKVTSIQADIIELDIGAEKGIKVGGTGRVYYTVTISGEEKPVYLAKFKIFTVSERSSKARIEEKEGDVKIGNLAEVLLEDSKERLWIEEEKRKLEEERARVEALRRQIEERQKLDEERRRLEIERKLLEEERKRREVEEAQTPVITYSGFARRMDNFGNPVDIVTQYSSSDIEDMRIRVGTGRGPTFYYFLNYSGAVAGITKFKLRFFWEGQQSFEIERTAASESGKEWLPIQFPTGLDYIFEMKIYVRNQELKKDIFVAPPDPRLHPSFHKRR